MKKYNILYDWPIAHITWLSRLPEAEAFSNSLDEDRQNEFVEITERIRGFGEDLEKVRTERQLFNQCDALLHCFEELQGQFGTFPNLKASKFRLSLLLITRLLQAVPSAPVGAQDLDDVDIDEEMFELRELTEPLPTSWFVRQNAKRFDDSVVVFSCVDLTKLTDAIASSKVSADLLFHLLVLIHALDEVPETHTALIKKENPAIESAAVDAFVKVLILASGEPIHSPRRYATTLSVIDRDCFQAGIPYQQLNDVFEVLSEYNSRHEVLTKYLTLYHVIENFMFKLPIVELEREKGGQMFSIRDFRRLYSRVEGSEQEALKKLFRATLQLPARPNLSFEKHILVRWKSLAPGVPVLDIEQALGALDVKKNRALKYSEFKSDVVGNFSQLVYAVRNAIVHNKETEFHLTYATLDQTITTLLESFLIPSLEEMCFTLVGNKNAYVWYEHKEMQLYK